MGDNRIKGTQYGELIKSKVWTGILGDHEVPEFIEEQLRTLLKKQTAVLRSCDKRALANFIKYEVNLNNLEAQFELFRGLKTLKANSLENYVVKYGPVHGPKKYEQKNKDSTVTLERYIQKYGEEEGRILWDELNSRKFHSEQTYIDKHGEAEGKLKWEEFKENCSKNKTIEKHILLYGEEEGTIRFEELRSKESNKYSLEWYSQNHGDERGALLYEERKKKLNDGASLEGYIKKYGEELGKQLCKERHDTTSLTSFQKRHGADEGYKKYVKYIEKQSYRKSRDFYIDTYGEEEGERLYLESIKKKQNNTSASKISQKLFWQIFNAINDKNITNYFKFYEYNKEYTTYSKTNSKCYMYDFVDMKSKKCIEFHGDIFHGNPTIFSESDTPHPWRKDTLCRQLWEEDSVKMKEITDRGFVLLVIWEKEYYDNPEATLIKCLNFLKYDYTIKD